jgi:hypothetical protein
MNLTFNKSRNDESSLQNNIQSVYDDSQITKNDQK